jgi:hypothetical protein
MADGRYRSRSGHVRTSDLIISVENDPNATSSNARVLVAIGPRVLTKVDDAVRVEPVGEFELKGIRRPLATYNVLAAMS